MKYLPPFRVESSVAASTGREVWRFDTEAVVTRRRRRTGLLGIARRLSVRGGRRDREAGLAGESPDVVGQHLARGGGGRGLRRQLGRAVSPGGGCPHWARALATGHGASRVVVAGGRGNDGICGRRIGNPPRAGSAPLRRAIFWDSTLVRASRVVTHRELRDYLGERGCEVLDAEGLARFMRQRLTDRSPSVVVFSIDHLPATVAPVPADNRVVPPLPRCRGARWSGPASHR
jgi:hypothetical protein